MLFKIVQYLVDEELEPKVPERLMLLDVESFEEALDLAKRVLSVEKRSDVTLSQFIGKVPFGARVLQSKMTFEELYELDPNGLATAL
jgi:hypothetical protein